jgi:phosphopantetheinyl transferase (holo-ACP synthase)
LSRRSCRPGRRREVKSFDPSDREVPRAAALLGVGIDLAEQRAFAHLGEASIRRAADRWLRPDERAWCAAQPAFREAMVIVLSCKEAVYKAWDSSGEVHELSLAMHGRGVRGRAVTVGTEPEVVALWDVSDGSILSLAAAGPAERAWELLERILSVRSPVPGKAGAAGRVPRPESILTRCCHILHGPGGRSQTKCVRQHAVSEPDRRHVSCRQSATITASNCGTRLDR